MYLIRNFKLAGYYPYVPLKSCSMELSKELKGCTPWLPAKVPGSVYDDLLSAGLIEDPYVDMNSLKCEWVSARWWVYAAEFDAPEGEPEGFELVLEGLDNHAHIFLNTEKLGEHESMFIPAVFDVTGKLKPRNVLKVVLESPPDEMGQIGYTSRTFTQKPRFAYKWDFGVRMPGVGVCGKVFLRPRRAAMLRDFHFRALCAARARIDLQIECLRPGYYTAQVSLERGGLREAVAALPFGESGTITADLDLPDAALWQPNGSGEHSLYDLRIELLTEGGDVLSERRARVGMRTVSLENNPDAPVEALGYTLTVNGRRTPVRGVNMVPLDMMYGRVTRVRYRQFVSQLVELNVNLVRVWGGGLIESEDFYELCDEAGIMVWQDFIQSSSGIDNFPSHRPEFLKLLGEVSAYAARVKRNHPCLAIFCGGNELMYEGFRPVGFEVENIALLAEIVKRECPEIAFLPTTPSGPRFSADFACPSHNHDVHGQWTYLGTEEHYRFFNDLQCLFHSEFGVDGIANASAIERSVSPAFRYVSDYDSDMFWRHRGEWWNTFKREQELFGETELFEQAELSQFLQAEGLRYALEANRRRAPRTSGCIVWQADEPFPNGSCTSLIDYYGEPKAAYYAVRNCYATVNASLAYDKLVYAPGEAIPVELFLTSADAGRARCALRVFSDGRLFLERRYETELSSSSARSLDVLKLSPSAKSNVAFELVSEQNGKRYVSRVLLLVRGTDGYCDKEACRAFAASLRQC